MVKKIIKIISFSLLTIVLIYGAYTVVSLKDSMGLTGTCVNQLKHTEDNLIDVVFVGTSHVYSSIMPGKLWSDYGISSFDLSVSGMGKESALQHIKYMLKTQSPKVVCVDMYALTFDGNLDGNDYRNFLSLPWSRESTDLINSEITDSEDRKNYYLRFPLIHTRYKELTKADFYDSDFAVYGRGEYISYQSGGNADLSAGLNYSEIGELSEENVSWLLSLSELARENDFRLILYSTPCTMTESKQGTMNALTEFAKLNNIEFIDFNKMPEVIDLFDEQDDFSDSSHLNSVGADKFTDWLGNYLVSTDDLDDHRLDEAFALWDYDSAYYLGKKNIQLLKIIKEQESADTLFETISNTPGIAYIVSLDGTWKDSTLPMDAYLDELNIYDDERDSGGVWIGMNGQVEKISSNENAEKIVYYDIDRYTSVRVNKAEENYQDYIRIDSDSVNFTANGINIIVYCIADHETVMSLGYY